MFNVECGMSNFQAQRVVNALTEAQRLIRKSEK